MLNLRQNVRQKMMTYYASDHLPDKMFGKK